MSIKIATWNVERLKHYKEFDRMMLALSEADADILVLTETDSRIAPEYPYAYATLPLEDQDGQHYKATENRVTVYSRYKAVEMADTSDPFTSICPVLETDNGLLAVYGTIIGTFGNRIAPFKEQVQQQTEDIKRITQEYENTCMLGDFNLSFCDNYYFTAYGRETVDKAFSECGIKILTRNVAECVDHIAVSKSYVHSGVTITEWNTDKTLSDHKGIAVQFS